MAKGWLFVILGVSVSNVFCQDIFSLQSFSLIDIRAASMSEKCRSQISRALEDLNSTDMWALELIDASGRLVPSGLLNGNIYELGNFDECINIKTVKNSETIQGKYCLGSVQLGNLKNLPKESNVLRLQGAAAGASAAAAAQAGMGRTKDVGYNLAVCVPDGCTAEDLNNTFIKFTEEGCSTKYKDKDLSQGAVTTIVFFSLILLIAAVSTIYDVYLYYMKQETYHPMCIAFSVFTNGRKLLQTSKGQDQLMCLHGLRSISMMWVILGHEYGNAMFDNMRDALEWSSNAKSMFILGATVSVDTFFVLAGLVTVYTYMKSCDKGVKFNIFLYYIHRYLRLTPALAVVLIFYVGLVNYVGDGPFWYTVEDNLAKPCRENWWQTLLYVQNYAVDGIMCIGQSWYLSVDMQLFLLSPLVLVPLPRWPKYTMIGMGFLCIAGVISPFLISWYYKLGGGIMQLQDMKTYYAATHARFGPYVMGMVAGYIIYKIKKTNYKLKVTQMHVIAFWILLLAGLTACVYAGYDLANAGQLANSLFTGFNRPAWGLGICLLTITCILGYGGPIDAFLSASIFQILGKLSYSMYLTHMGLLQVHLSASRTTTHFSDPGQMFIYWAYVAETIAYSVLLCLLFESPMITIERLLLGGLSKPKPKEAKTQAFA